MLYDAAKRAFDVIAATSGLAVLSPIIAATALAVRSNMGSPVLFQSRRAGLHGDSFVLYKFRSMRDAYDAAGEPLPDAERLTAIGELIRSWSLDELPQLWNVVNGTMSIVGPRPLPMPYVELYSKRQALRLKVKPGITGYGAIKGRNALEWDEQLELDAWYVEHRGIMLDLKILLLTVRTVLGREGVNQPGTASREPFRGPGKQATKPC